MTACPRLIIGGASSGVGKTSLTLGLAAALRRRGLRVQCFKVGPDFLDPTYLSLVSGRPCYNLDGWMTGRDYVCDLFARATADADVALVEGVMGLFDGASPDSLEGSTAEIATWLDAPVLLVVNAHGAARSLAATVKGFAEFEPGVRVGGVIANQAGSDHHRQWLSAALSAAKLPPLVGAVPRGALPPLPSRHLGLVTADAAILPAAAIEQLADACEKHVDIGQLIIDSGQWTEARGQRTEDRSQRSEDRGQKPEVKSQTSLNGKPQETVAGQVMCAPCPWPPRSTGEAMPPESGCGRGAQHPQASTLEGGTNGRQPGRPLVRIGVARDEAFHFYYPDNLEMLQRQGAELVPFSPLHDHELPAGLGGLYIGGGYPEVHAEALAANETLRADVRQFAASGRCVWAECGGLMYLGRSIRTLEGKVLPMAGVVPIDTEMLKGLRTLGYVEATTRRGSFWGAAGTRLRGHEFHYSQLAANDAAANDWPAAYEAKRRRSEGATDEGFHSANVLASYVHLHLGSCPQAARSFVHACKEAS